ncbi:MAG: TRAP transporter large permease subunit [Bacteroidetes bacterium]|nr:TRAP transporter large permease subunit [Bacteroidota bacterium]
MIIELNPMILFVFLILLLMLGYPVAFSLGGLSLIVGALTFGVDFFNLLPLRVWGIMTNYVMLAVPLFVFMGVMLEKSGLANDLLETMALLFGKLKGGLAISVLFVGLLLAASTGIVGATVVTMGLLSLPTMLKRGYKPELATGTIVSAGTLGQIIPPSIVLVLLGSVLNVSIGDLFIGALIPGMLIVGLYFILILIIAHIKPEWAPAMPSDELAAFEASGKWKRVGKSLAAPIGLMVAVLGSIFTGIASPTEAAAVGAAGATLMTWSQGKLNRDTLLAVMKETTWLTSMVMIILVGATAFGLVFRGAGGDLYLAGLISHFDLSPHHFLLIVMITVFIAGFFIDFIEICFIIVPVVTPLFIQMGIDLTWIGILLAVNLQTSFLTPPFGFALFYLKGVAPPGITTGHLYRGIIPFIAIQLLVLLLVALFPELSLSLVHWIGG